MIKGAKVLVLNEDDFQAGTMNLPFSTANLTDDGMNDFQLADIVFLNGACVKDSTNAIGDIASHHNGNNAKDDKEIAHLESEIDSLLDDISQFRANQLALKAVISDVVNTLADTEELTTGEIDEAVRMLRHARDSY